MKWKMAVATMTAAAMVSAPVAGAAPSNSNANANANGGRANVGQTISAIARNGGGAAGVLGALGQLKPGNLGLANAFQRVTAPKTTTPTPTATPTPAPSA